MHLILDAVGHRFGQQPWLFRSLSRTLEPGETYALTGPSGSGKSTLMGILAGWIQPTEGAVQRDPLTRIQWVFQAPHGTARRSAVDHVAQAFLARGTTHSTARVHAHAVLERFGLGHRSSAQFHELSGGEAQRLMLARAVATSSGLLLIDEPTAQLDQTTSRSVAAVISQLANASTVVVVATHDADTRDACSQRIDLSLTSDEVVA